MFFHIFPSVTLSLFPLPHTNSQLSPSPAEVQLDKASILFNALDCPEFILVMSVFILCPVVELFYHIRQWS